MASKEEDEEISLEDLTVQNMYTIDALANILIRRGLITEKELSDEIMKIDMEH